MSEEYKAQIKQILLCLQQEQTRKAALDIILSLSESPELSDIFIEFELPKLLVKLIESDKIENKDVILQILINFSSNEKYIPSFIKINIFHRIITILFNLFKLSLPKTEAVDDPNDIIISSDKNLVDKGQIMNVQLQFDKYVLNSNNLIDNKDNKELQNESLINLYFMLMTNLTSFEVGQMKFLDIDNDNIKGILFFKLLDKFFEYAHHNAFNFFSNVIANVSSLKAGREIVLENKIFKIFLIQLDKMNNMKIMNMLRFFRNCSFEYEKYESQLLERNGIMFSFLIKLLFIVDDLKKSSKFVNAEVDEIYYNNFSTSNLESSDMMIINDLIIDILLILTNSENCVKAMKEKGLGVVIDLLEEKLQESNVNRELKEKLKDRMDVLKNYMQV